MKPVETGFSLLELLLVLALISVLSLTGGRTLYWLQDRWALWQTSQQLTQFLSHLRSEANGRNCHAILQLVQDMQGDYIMTCSTLNKTCYPQSSRQFRPLYNGVVIEQMTEGLGFYGEINAARNGTIWLKNAAGRYKIMLSVWGRIRSYLDVSHATK